jgi:predicted porin
MEKKLIAVAVAGALAAPGAAFAQISTVQISGQVIQYVGTLDQGGTSLRTDLQYNSETDFTVRGEEQLGGSLSAWFQCGSSFSLNDGGGNTLCGKNNAIGFKGNWGAAFVGMWDTPYKIANAPLRPFSGGTVFGAGAQLWGATANNVGNGVAGGNNSQTASDFHRRARNSIQYWSPNWAGFEFKAAVTNSNEATAQTSATTASKPRMWSVGASYTNGPFYAGLGYSRHKNFNPASVANYLGGKDHSWSGGAAYTFAGVFKASFIYSRQNFDTNIGGINEMHRNAWVIYGDWAITGPHRLRMGYAVAQDTKGTLGTAAAPVQVGVARANGGAGDTGSKLYSLQYAYAFSKRTEVNFGYAKVNNDRNANYVLQTTGAQPGVFTGADQSSWTAGIRHTF